jgi:hypothetical protein
MASDLVELTTNKLFNLAEAIFVLSDRERVAEKTSSPTGSKDAVRNGQITMIK